MILLGRKEEILALLEKRSLTSKDISSELSISKDDVRKYLQRLKKDHKIRVIGIKEGYKIYSAHDPIELLSFLNTFFKDNVSYLARNQEIYEFILSNEEIFNKIEELVK